MKPKSFIFFILLFTIKLTAQNIYKVGKKDTLFKEISTQKKFTAKLKSSVYPIPLNKMHNWVLYIETSDAKIVENASIQIIGGMPEHGHGFPTTPSVSKHIGDGNYLVEGIKFNMYGLWLMEFRIATPWGFDNVKYLLKITP